MPENKKARSEKQKAEERIEQLKREALGRAKETSNG
jgi:hypothetical protein